MIRVQNGTVARSNPAVTASKTVSDEHCKPQANGHLRAADRAHL
jgi:hypothetical protein